MVTAFQGKENYKYLSKKWLKQYFNLVLLELDINLTSSWLLASKTNIIVQKGGYVNTFLFLCRREFDTHFQKLNGTLMSKDMRLKVALLNMLVHKTTEICQAPKSISHGQEV